MHEADSRQLDRNVFEVDPRQLAEPERRQWSEAELRRLIIDTVNAAAARRLIAR